MRKTLIPKTIFGALLFIGSAVYASDGFLQSQSAEAADSPAETQGNHMGADSLVGRMSAYRGGMMVGQKDLSRAIGDFQKTFRLSPDNLHSYDRVSRGLQVSTKIAEAQLEFERVFDRDPVFLAMWHWGYASQRKNSEARLELSRVIEVDPFYAAPGSNLWLALFEKSETADVTGKWERNVRLNSGMADAGRSLAIGMFTDREERQAAGGSREALAMEKRFADMSYFRHVPR